MDETREIDLEECIILPEVLYRQIGFTIETPKGKISSSLRLGAQEAALAVTAGTLEVLLVSDRPVSDVLTFETGEITVDSAWWDNPMVDVIDAAEWAVNEVLKDAYERAGGIGIRKRWFEKPQVRFIR